MSDVQVSQALEEDRGGTRILGILAVAFAVLFVAGMFAGFNTPGYDESSQKWADWFGDEANRAAAIMGMMSMALASLVLVWFSAVVASALQARMPGRAVPTLVLASGTFAAAAFAIGRVVTSSIAGALTFAPDYDVIPSVELLQAFEQAGIGVMLVAGGWSAALFVIALSMAARSTELLPAWLGTAGMVAGALLLLSVLFLPLLLFPLFMLVAGIVLWTSGPRTTA